jgi:hypothetical protein
MDDRTQDGYGIPYIDRGEPLPESYGETRIDALVRDPEGVYVYWDVDTEIRVSGSPLVLCSHVLTTDEKQFTDLEPGTISMYFAVSSNTPYQFELYERGPEGDLLLLAQSDEVTTPVRQAGESGEQAPAEIRQTVKYPIARRPADAEEVAAAMGASATGFTPQPASMPEPQPTPMPGNGHWGGSSYTNSVNS